MRATLISVLLVPQLLFAQKWVDTVYQIAIERDSIYGASLDFAGNWRELSLDIAYPVGDTAPECGRPLAVILYGGAWMGGSKDVAEVQALLKEFAKRGYVAMAPNYRLGMFQTSTDRNCNISGLGLEWNCLNMQDTAEWYRAYYRAIQDVRGAIRFMIKHAVQYQLDPNNVFVAGFSAGGFTALGVGFLDHPSEWKAFAGALPDAQRPHARYDVGCVQKFQWDTSAASMDLVRADLGSMHGSLHPGQEYSIKAVGNLFGGMFYNLLDSGSAEPPAIYGFHQPNDLIVPYYRNQTVFHGYNACAYPFCNMGIINRPHVYSSPIIRDWAQQASHPVDFYFDSTLNNTDCAGQIADPSKGGHQLDNWNRTWNMAVFFASKIDTSGCVTTHVAQMEKPSLLLYPNPSQGMLHVHCDEEILALSIQSVNGSLVKQIRMHPSRTVRVEPAELPQGVYIIEVRLASGDVLRTKWILINVAP